MSFRSSQEECNAEQEPWPVSCSQDLGSRHSLHQVILNKGSPPFWAAIFAIFSGHARYPLRYFLDLTCDYRLSGGTVKPFILCGDETCQTSVGNLLSLWTSPFEFSPCTHAQSLLCSFYLEVLDIGVCSTEGPPGWGVCVHLHYYYLPDTAEHLVCEYVILTLRTTRSHDSPG